MALEFYRHVDQPPGFQRADSSGLRASGGGSDEEKVAGELGGRRERITIEFNAVGRLSPSALTSSVKPCYLLVISNQVAVGRSVDPSFTPAISFPSYHHLLTHSTLSLTAIPPSMESVAVERRALGALMVSLAQLMLIFAAGVGKSMDQGLQTEKNHPPCTRGVRSEGGM